MSAPCHPYAGQPARAFWSRSVSTGFSASELLAPGDPLIRRGDAIVSAGSCFASNLVPYLERAGLTFLRTETMHPAFAKALAEPLERDNRLALGGRTSLRQRADELRQRLARGRTGGAPTQAPDTDNFGYAKFSAAYGNIYTVRHLLQLLRRATGRFTPRESFWAEDDETIVDPFRPGLRFKARSREEHATLTAQHLALTLEAFATADVFVLTLGLTEAWVSREDGAVFPACPGTIGGSFDPQRHMFHNFTAAEVGSDLEAFIAEVRERNARCRFVLTVSPVPLVATAGPDHVLRASTYSKAVLRVAAQEAAARLPDITYFPAYEIVTGPQAPKTYLARDLRNVTPEAVDAVMAVMIGRCEVATGAMAPGAGPTTRAAAGTSKLSAALLDAECEEVMSEREWS